MDERIVVALIVSTTFVTGFGSTTHAGPLANKSAFAQVNDVKPVKRLMRSEREVCRDVQVEYVRPARDKRGFGGSFFGALFGGRRDSQTDKSKDSEAAIESADATGAYEEQEETLPDNVFANIERTCSMVVEPIEELVGYEVHYRIGKLPEAIVRTNYDPGDRIPVHNGKLILDGKTRVANTK